MRNWVSLIALSLPTAPFAKRQVYLSRHCVRSSDDDASIADYSAYAMPDWGVPGEKESRGFHGWCTTGGMDIMRKTGKDLVDSFGFEPDNVRFFSDPYMRDADTAFGLLEGMGMQHVAVDYDEILFNPIQMNEDGTQKDDSPCHAPAWGSAEMTAEMRARFNKVPLPWDYKSALAEMQEIIGVGPAGRLEDIDGPDAGIVLDDNGIIGGAAKVMTMFAQDMLYAYASDIPYLNATKEQINKFVAWHAWWMSAAFVDNSYMATSNVFLLHRFLDDLKTASTTNVYAAHDANVDGIASILGLRWNASPYAPAETNGELVPTPPGCGLLFEYEDDGAVTVKFVWRTFDHDDVFNLSHSEVARYGSMSEFEQAIMSGLKNFIGAEECWDKAGAPVLV